MSEVSGAGLEVRKMVRNPQERFIGWYFCWAVYAAVFMVVSHKHTWVKPGALLPSIERHLAFGRELTPWRYQDEIAIAVAIVGVAVIVFLSVSLGRWYRALGLDRGLVRGVVAVLATMVLTAPLVVLVNGFRHPLMVTVFALLSTGVFVLVVEAVHRLGWRRLVVALVVVGFVGVGGAVGVKRFADDMRNTKIHSAMVVAYEMSTTFKIDLDLDDSRLLAEELGGLYTIKGHEQDWGHYPSVQRGRHGKLAAAVSLSQGDGVSLTIWTYEDGAIQDLCERPDRTCRDVSPGVRAYSEQGGFFVWVAATNETPDIRVEMLGDVDLMSAEEMDKTALELVGALVPFDLTHVTGQKAWDASDADRATTS